MPPPAEPGRHAVRVVESRPIAPGPGMPADLPLGHSNNNLDVVRHAGRVVLALRTAPHHFASPDTEIVVVSSDDEIHWQLESRFSLGTDLREPRLLSLGDRLLLYVSRLGSDPLAFQPRGLAVAERGASGDWSALEPFGPPGVMGWRVRRLGDQPVMLVYFGGGSIYGAGPPRLRVELWKTDDGRRFEPFDPQHPAVYEGGGSEADCVLDAEGRLFGVIRNEAGDANGFGSLVCRAPADALARWHCVPDRRKYDSPFAFTHRGEAYVVARRNLRATGEYDLARGPGRLARSVWNQVNYSLTPKRTALWRFVPGQDRLAWVTDLPSRGDCCFPAVIDGAGPDEQVVYDYSCPLDGPDLPWIRGQRGRTSVYRHVLAFSDRNY